MANPQVENGHTKIANEILEQLMKIHLSPNQWQVLICIIRKTYGFHKKVDYIANFQIIEATGLCKAVVSRVLATLESMNLIIRQGKYIGFQKNWEEWVKLAEQSTKVSRTVNSLKLAEQSTLATELAEQSTSKKLAISTTELAEQSTKVSSPRVTQKKYVTITKEKRKSLKLKTQELLSTYSPDFQKAFSDYSEMRIKIKRPLTPRAIELALKKLKDLSPSEQGQVAIINQSIFNSYQGLFPLKQIKNNGHNPTEPTKTINEQLAEKRAL
jgi:phage replication O-like protein O